jgi:hypothetical protein
VQHDTIASVARFVMYDAKEPCSAGADSDGAVVTDSATRLRQPFMVLAVFELAAAASMAAQCAGG